MQDSYINRFNQMTKDQQDSELAGIRRVKWQLAQARGSLLLAEKIALEHRVFDFEDMTTLHKLVTAVETAEGDLFDSEAVIQSMSNCQDGTKGLK